MKKSAGGRTKRTSRSTTRPGKSSGARTFVATTPAGKASGVGAIDLSTTRSRATPAGSVSRPQRAVLRKAREQDALQRNRDFERQRHGARVVLPIRDGCVMVVSDQHYLPGVAASPAHKASVRLAKILKPWAVIANGDAIDGSSISRWPASSFVDLGGRPLVAAEIGVTVKRLAEYEDFDFVKYLVWNMGNHDARYETWLAEKAPQYRGVDGFTLKEHFPFWLPAWRTDLTARPGEPPTVIVKHRFKGGMHAGQNNVLWSGASSVTGHDHMLKAYPISNARGLHWGIHAGTTAPIDSPLFTHYTEDNVVNWQSGFVFLHFRGGHFTGPELVHVTADGHALFRGDRVRV